MRRLTTTVLGLLVIIFACSFIFIPEKTNAQVGATISTTVADTPRTTATIKDTIWQAIIKAGKASFLTSLRAVVNQVAFQTATYIGSGGSGQKPLYETKPFGQWLADIGDAAAGNFVETFVADQQQSNPDSFFKKYNVCAPNIAASVKISLGLTDFSNKAGGLSTNCSIKNIYDAAVNQYDLITKPDYLKNLAATAFDPQTSDIGIAFSLFGQQVVDTSQQAANQEKDRVENKGWLDVRTLISGERKGPPGTTQAALDQANTLKTQSILTQTGDVFVDAANIFLNQLALSAFNKLIQNLSSNGSSGSSSAGGYYSQGGVGGVTEVSQRASSILQAQFNELSDYDVLSQLSSCQDEQKPGPTNCVITQQFSQAISRGLTVADALGQKLLDGNKRIGYDQQGNDFSYRDGYPYRSLIILRKYRILPVGWEVAAQYIKNNSQATKDVTLGDLIACFSHTDEDVYPGYWQPWCDGLVDPNWVLKLPKMYCGMQGYGPEILSALSTPSSTGYCTKSNGNCSGAAVSGTANCATDYHPCSGDLDCVNEATNKTCNFTVGHDVQVSRNNTYCADEQSCIKENSNGSCAYYGYCTEEKRRWIFSQDQSNSCEPRNNTCQTFKSDTGVEASYLENTLNYGNCGANDVGCRQYAMTGAYNTTTAKVSWSSSAAQQHFNKNATTCDPASEGCHQFVRMQDDTDTNLIADGSFELSQCVGGQGGTYLPKDKTNPLIKTALAQVSQGTCQLQTLSSSGTLARPNDRWYIRVNSGSVQAGISNDQSEQGSQSLYIEGAGGLYSRDNGSPTLLPTGFTFDTERYYTIVASVYVVAGKVRIGFGAGVNGQSAESTATGSWQTLVVSYYRPDANGASDFYVEGEDSSAKFYIDSFKLTVGSASTSYSDYLTSNVVYEKLLPAYLESTCYTQVGNDYRYKANAPAECFNFARKCNAEEVGCSQYTSDATGIDVTGKAKAKDICPDSCVGYNVFIQQPNNFNPSDSADFIPKTAKTCSAQAVGCTAFTNLDKLSQGAEALEYYSSMRSCIKPDATACGEFYTWEGSDEAGFQLKVFSLKQNGSQPASTMSGTDEAAVCNADIFKKSPYEVGYNFDCREFYARDGSISYHLYTKTISCSDNCHPYRREVANSAACTAGGGTWDATESRCLYYAIPEEGTKCSAAEVNCQQYTGNIAGDVKTVLLDSFEDTQAPTSGWTGGSQSNTSLNLGGHSLLGTTLSKVVGDNVHRNSSYTISFLAKPENGTPTVSDISFANQANETASFVTNGTNLASDWRLYTFNLGNLDHDVTAVPGGDAPGGSGEKLQITFSAGVYIDNIKLTEVPNRYYLLKNSWQTPDECDQTVTGAYSLHYMLGCSQYTKADKTTVNLHSFSQLCQDSAAGCEQMIDTNNSSGYGRKLYNDTNSNGVCDSGEVGCVEVKADAILNAVYDKTKECGQEAKGCSRLGLTTSYNNIISYSDSYLNNNPDTYNTSLCSAAGVGCSQWSSQNGSTVYFKDPGNEVCEWRLKAGTNSDYQWFRKKVKQCNGSPNGTLCSADTDCTSGQSCLLVDQDIACTNTSDSSASEKTIGSGGSAGRVLQPSNWAGACEATQAGCTEYIEPLSKINDNLILNPSYLDLDGHPPIEYWIDGPGNNEAHQTVSLFPQTAYILKGDGQNNPTASVKISCNGGNAANGEGLRILDSNNNFVQCKTATDPGCGSANTSDYIIGLDKSFQFYIQRNAGSDRVDCTVTRSNRVANASVSLRQAIVDYQLSQNLDRSSANGLVNQDKGAVLFNERAQSGGHKEALLYNADGTYQTPTQGVSPATTDPKNANVILTVKPDRTCSKWLSCLTSLPDPNNPSKQTCLDVGLCDSLDANGNCNDFINAPTKNQNLITNTSIGNLTGYSKIGYAKRTQNTLSDFYNLGAMTQVGETVDIRNGGFEGSSEWTSTTGGQILTQPGQISQKHLTPMQAVKGQVSTDFLAPEGQGVLFLPTPTGNSTTETQTNSISLISDKRYVISFYSYSKGDGLKVKLLSQTGTGNLDLSLKHCSASQAYCSTDADCTSPETCQADNASMNKWVKQTIGFKAGSPSYKIAFEKTGDGDAYVDDVRIEAGLNARCSGTNTDQTNCEVPGVGDRTPNPQFIGSSCRLYSNENSLSCLYTDSDNVTHQGVRGYCLENDPKDPGTCLLWYPVGRIAGDTQEEGSGVNFNGKDVYYCVNATDACVTPQGGGPTVPGVYCTQFLKVDSSKYWNQRLASGASFTLPNPPATADPFFFPTTGIGGGRFIDFGAKGGKIDLTSGLTWGMGNGYYGSLLTTTTPANSAIFVTRDLVNGNINSFLPYFGAISSASSNLCGHATESISNDDNPSWDSTTTNNKYDACYIKYSASDESGSDGLAYCKGGPDNPQCSGSGPNCNTAYPATIHINGGIGGGGGQTIAFDNYANMDIGEGGICGIDNIYTQCASNKDKDNNGLLTGYWKLWLANNNTGGTDKSSECRFDCYDKAQGYRVANSAAHSVDAIRRLFVGTYLHPADNTHPDPYQQPTNWQVYTWNGSGYATNQPSPSPNPSTMPQCTNNIRPAYPNDYCYVLPSVSDIKVRGLNDQDIVVNGSEDVPVSFNTHTDSQQLPLTHITVDWGYQDITQTEQQLDLTGGNYADVNPRTVNHRFDYLDISGGASAPVICHQNYDERCQGAESCCIIKPKITITDNWGYFAANVPFAKTIIVKKP